MISSVSTTFCSSAMPASAVRMRRCAFEVERLGHDADGEDAHLARGLGDDRRSAGAGAAAHAGGDEHHVGAGQMIADFVDHFLRPRRADIRLRAGAEALGHLRAHLDDALGLRHGQRLRVGVGDDEVDALQPGRDHVVDGVAAGAADAEHGDPRLQLADVGDVQIDAHGCLSITTRALVRPRPAAAGVGESRVVLESVIRSPREAIVRPVRNSRQSLS